MKFKTYFRREIAYANNFINRGYKKVFYTGYKKALRDIKKEIDKGTFKI